MSTDAPPIPATAPPEESTRLRRVAKICENLMTISKQFGPFVKEATGAAPVTGQLQRLADTLQAAATQALWLAQHPRAAVDSAAIEADVVWPEEDAAETSAPLPLLQVRDVLARLAVKVVACLETAPAAAVDSGSVEQTYHDHLLDARDISWEILRTLDGLVREIRPAQRPAELAHDACFDLLGTLNQTAKVLDAIEVPRDNSMSREELATWRTQLFGQMAKQEDALYLLIEDFAITQMPEAQTPPVDQNSSPQAQASVA